eukprot:1460750-Prymnesium_polylepis.1
MAPLSLWRGPARRQPLGCATAAPAKHGADREDDAPRRGAAAVPRAAGGAVQRDRPLQPARGGTGPRDRHAAGDGDGRRDTSVLVLPGAAHADRGTGGAEHGLPRHDAAAAPARPPQAQGRGLVLDRRGGQRLVVALPRLLRPGLREAGAPAARPGARGQANELQGLRVRRPYAGRDALGDCV